MSDTFADLAQGDEWPTYYYGRKWDAPLTDDAILMAEELVAALFPQPCSCCQEPVTAEDDIILTPGMCTHLECNVRSILGDVQHLEGRCMCSRGTGNEITYDSDNYETYRDSAKAALQWLIDHHRGRFHD